MMQIGKEYAEALFMLASEKNMTEEYGRALSMIKKLAEEHAEYTELLSSPALTLDERLRAVDEAFAGDVPDDVLSFLKLLCEKRRTDILVECIKEYEKLSLELSRRTGAVITSAVEMSDDQKKAVCLKLEKITGKIIDPVFAVDAALIGGLKAEVDGKVYDGTLKNRLRDVKDVIIG